MLISCWSADGKTIEYREFPLNCNQIVDDPLPAPTVGKLAGADDPCDSGVGPCFFWLGMGDK